MDQPKFVISSSEVESMIHSLKLSSVYDLLPLLVNPAQSLARPPVSNFRVGAVGLGSDGRIFLGVNLEFPGMPLNQSVHAEQFLLTNLAVHGCPRLLYFAVSAAPCGHCRQFMQELRYSSSLQILVTSESPNVENSVSFRPLFEFLPSPFGPADLLDEDSPLFLEPHENELSFTTSTHVNSSTNLENSCNGDAKSSNLDDNSGNISDGICGKITNDESLLKTAALEAANNSHAPYTNCPSGIALMDSDGKVYKGSYTESAAYNPSLGPVQAALVAFIAGGGGGYEKIISAALVEKENGKISQEDIARLLLKKISPNCEFTVFNSS